MPQKLITFAKNRQKECSCNYLYLSLTVQKIEYVVSANQFLNTLTRLNASFAQIKVILTN